MIEQAIVEGQQIAQLLRLPAAVGPGLEQDHRIDVGKVDFENPLGRPRAFVAHAKAHPVGGIAETEFRYGDPRSLEGRPRGADFVDSRPAVGVLENLQIGSEFVSFAGPLQQERFCRLHGRKQGQ